MLELNRIYNCNCLDGLRQLDDNSVDMTVTSPPYDNLRSYRDENTGDGCEWNFEVFKPIARELYRVTRKGGVVVWVVGDACIDNGETGSSFRQALYFQELGFKIHDTMIYEKNSSSFPAKLTSKRYSQIFEYMFVFSKGKIRGDLKLIADKRNKWAGWTNWGEHSQYDAEGNLVKTQNIKPIAEFSLRTNIWRYPVSFNDKTGHPAVFPEKLAEDHILSWSNEGETVLDPFMGSGTTAKMAMMNNRNFIGFEVNTGYYEASLKRLEKYEGKTSGTAYEIPTDDVLGIEDIDSDTIQTNPVDDKDYEKKKELWTQLTSELEDYFNTQSLGILKNLRVNLSFASKANDRRVESVLKERGLLSGTPQNLPSYCEGAKGPQEYGDWTDKKEEYAAPSVTVEDKPKREVGNSILSKFIRYSENKDEFIRDCVSIKPSGVKMKGQTTEPAYEPVKPGSSDDGIIRIIKEQTKKGGIIFNAIMEALYENEMDKIDNQPYDSAKLEMPDNYADPNYLNSLESDLYIPVTTADEG